MPDFGTPRASSTRRCLAPRAELVERLESAEVSDQCGDASTGEGRFTGLTMVLTGTMQHGTRPELARRLEAMGATVASSSRGRHPYHRGREGRVEAQKANDLGIEIWDEASAGGTWKRLIESLACGHGTIRSASESDDSSGDLLRHGAPAGVGSGGDLGASGHRSAMSIGAGSSGTGTSASRPTPSRSDLDSLRGGRGASYGGWLAAAGFVEGADGFFTAGHPQEGWQVIRLENDGRYEVVSKVASRLDAESDLVGRRPVRD